MCGRASLTKTEKELEDRFQATFYSEELERYNPLPNYNIAPTHMHPVMHNQDRDHLHFFKWGLIPFWAKDEKIGSRMINARLETVLEKNAYKQPVQKRRCLVPFDGFYEWKKVDKQMKIPFRITVTDQDIFCIAGLWEQWKSPEGEDVHSFTLITRDANELVGEIHDRMPAILMREDEQHWIDPELPAKDAVELLKPYPSDRMRAYPVSRRVNKVSENDKDLIREDSYPELDGKQGDLFNH